MDPERNWIARLEPETSEERSELDEAPIARLPRLVGTGVVLVGGGLALAGVLDEDLRILKVAALAAAALVTLIVTLIRHGQTTALRG